MSSVQLLDKTRKIGKLLHNNNSSKVVFSDICKVMREILNSNVLVISRKGKVLGVGKSDGIEPITELLDDSIGGFIDPMLNERLLVHEGECQLGDSWFREYRHEKVPGNHHAHRDRR